MTKAEGRTSGEVLVLLFGGTIAVSICLLTLAVALVWLANPDADLTKPVAAIAGVLNTLLGLVAGFLVGRGDGSPPQ